MASSPVNSAGGDIETGDDANGNPSALPQPSTQSEPTGRELFRENRKRSVGLYTAALNGDWETAIRLFENDPPRDILRASITKEKETVLHVAAGARQTTFVEKLIRFMEREDLELEDKNQNNAFCLAAAAGAKSIAEIMIDKNQKLPNVRGVDRLTPLHLAAMFGQDDMVSFLTEILEREDRTRQEIQEREDRSRQELQEKEDRTRLFFIYIDVGWFDLALKLLTKDEELAVIRHDDRGTALHMLARMPSAFSSKSPGIGKTLINACMKRNLNQNDDALKLVTCLWEKVLERADSEVLQLIRERPARGPPELRAPKLLFEAAKLGNFKFLAELVRLYPSLIWERDENSQTMFHIAVLHRHVSIFNQIHKLGSIKDIIVDYEVGLDTDEGPYENNNILHLAAKLPCPSRLNVVSGAALQMQRELIWFQEVEKIMPPSSREKKNSKGLTPRELFTKEHKDLLKDGEKWMMDRAHFFMLVATIITTVVFAAAFSVPGGISDSKGTPNHLEENWFQVFTVSEAIAFSCSLISTMMFLSILTSRYTEKDFLESLPCKLMAGLLTLFVSMIAMMAAFTAAFFVAYRHEKTWAPILTSAMAFLPAAVFVWLQRSLFSDVFKSRFFSSSPFHAGKPMIC